MFFPMSREVNTRILEPTTHIQIFIMEAQRGHHDKLNTSNMCVCMCVYIYICRKNQAPKYIEDGIECPQNEGEDKWRPEVLGIISTVNLGWWLYKPPKGRTHILQLGWWAGFSTYSKYQEILHLMENRYSGEKKTKLWKRWLRNYVYFPFGAQHHLEIHTYKKKCNFNHLAGQI